MDSERAVRIIPVKEKNMRKFAFLWVLAFAPLVLWAQEDTLTVVKNLDQIEVVAPLRQPTATTQTVTRSNLQTMDVGQNLPFLLSAVPSLVATSDDGLGIGYTYFRVRGTDHTRINMTINDVPLNDQESQTVFWVNLTDMASSLGSLNVQRGVGTSVNGSSAFGASVNMSTLGAFHKPEKTQVELLFNGGMYNTFREMASAEVLLPHNWYANARFSKVNSDGYLYRSASDLYSYAATVGYDNKATQVSLSVFGGKEKTGMAWDGVSQADLERDRRYNPSGEYTDDEGNTAYYNDQTDNYEQLHAQLHLTQKLLPCLWLNATLHYTFGAGYYNQYKAGKKFSAFGLEPYYDADSVLVKKSDFVRLKNLKNHFYGGVLALRYISEPVDVVLGGAVNNYQGNHWGNITYIRDPHYPFGLPLNYEYYRSTGEKLDANVYLKALWRVVNKNQNRLSLYGDLQYRYVHYQIAGINDEDLMPIPVDEQFHFFNPKAGISYERKGHLVYFNFALANREPSRKNYTECGIHDIPRPERLFDYELGYAYTHSRFTVGANLYYMDYKNQLVLTGKISDTGAALTRNVDKSYRMGIELNGAVKIVHKSLAAGDLDFDWSGNVCVSRSRILNYTDWVDLYDADWNYIDQKEVNFGDVAIAFSPTVTACSVFELKVAGFGMHLQTNVVGKQYLDNTMSSEAMLKAYCTTDLGLAYRLPIRYPEVKITCQFNNLFNAKYESNGGNYFCQFTDGHREYSPWYYAQAGFNVHAGFSVTL